MSEEESKIERLSGRRTILKGLGTFATSSLIMGTASAADGSTVDVSEASEFFQKKIEQHGRVIDSEIKGLDESSSSSSPNWRIKYTFQDGSKFPTFYDLREDSLIIRAVNERFNIDRESYEEELRQKREEIEKMEDSLDQDLKAKAAELNTEDN